jgi:hypothetical protein
VRKATQPVKPAVNAAKDVASSVTNTAKQEVRKATQPVEPTVDTAKDVASSVPRTAKQAVRKVTQPAPRPEGTETDGPAPAVPSVIDTDPAKTISDTDSEGGLAGGRSTSPTADSDGDNRRAGVRTTTRTADSSQQSRVRGAGMGADRATGGVATTSVKRASAVTPVQSAAGRVRRTTTRSSQRAIVPPRTVSTPSSGLHTDLVVAKPRSTASGAQPPSSENAADSSPFGFSLPGFLWPPDFLPPPLVIAKWLLHAATALLICVAVLLASGFWARRSVLRF